MAKGKLSHPMQKSGPFTPTSHPFRGISLLALALLLSKLLSAVYKVPLQNLTGDAGFYVYQQVYPLYGIGLVFTYSGLPVFISKFLAECQTDQDRLNQAQKIFTLLVMLSLPLSLLLFALSGSLAQVMGDGHLSTMIKLVSLFYLFIPFLATSRGFFQSKLDMAPVALSQVLEQLGRVTIIILAALAFASLDISLYQMGGLAMTSSILSPLLASLVLLLFFNQRDNGLSQSFGFSLPSWGMVKAFIVEGGQTVVVYSLLLFFQLLDSFTVFKNLKQAGLSAGQAMLAKGVYDRAQPFAQVGLTLALAMAMNLVPSLAQFFNRGDYKGWLKLSQSTFKLSLVLGSATSLGLIAVMPLLNQAFFADSKGTQVLQLYMALVFFLSISLTLHAILQSTSVDHFTGYAILFVLGLKALLNPLLIRSAGIMGAGSLTVVLTALLSLIMFIQVPRQIWQFIFQARFLVKYLLANGLMYLPVSYLANLSPDQGRLGALLEAVALSGLGLIIYTLASLRLKILDPASLDSLPFAKILKKVGGYYD